MCWRSGVGGQLLPAPLGPLLPLLPAALPAICPKVRREWTELAEQWLWGAACRMRLPSCWWL